MNSSVAEAAPAVSPLSQRVLAEQIKTIILRAPQSVAAAGALGAVSALVVWDYAKHRPMMVTLAFLYATSFWLLTFYWRYKRTNPSAADVRQWAYGNTLRVVAHGCSWGAYSLAIFVPNSIGYQAFDVAFMYGISAGAMAATSHHYRTFVLFAVPILLPVIVRCFFEGSLSSMAVGAAGSVGLLHNLYTGLHSSRSMAASIRTRFENVDLVYELGQQKQTAESARAQAEAANLSKSRFLAAASHDLRQPVHALGLFVSAAMQPSTETELKLIIGHMDRSVRTLAALFDSLLDVSRLDAGVLQPQIATIPLAPFMRQLAEEYAPEAQEKGLQLRVHCAELVIRTDPLLLERMLRNLVSNALRYTERGGVLLAARRRDAQVRIEVWDTGIGIAAEKQTQVFEEFYQIGNPERDRRNGVGLGLAIVKRVAQLLQHALQLTSRLGQGTRLSITVPIAADTGDKCSRSADFASDDESVLLGAVVVVIDDETDILAAIELLLRQWGCKVIAVESGMRAKENLQSNDMIPDVILSDYRLRDGETGVRAIRVLRDTYGDGIPALLLTGDTGVDRLRDAAASGLEVLHKPLNADQLKLALIRSLS